MSNKLTKSQEDLDKVYELVYTNTINKLAKIELYSEEDWAQDIAIKSIDNLFEALDLIEEMLEDEQNI